MSFYLKFYLIVVIYISVSNSVKAQVVDLRSSYCSTDAVNVYVTNLGAYSAVLNASLHTNLNTVDSITIWYELRTQYSIPIRDVGKHVIHIKSYADFNAFPFEVSNLMPNTVYNFDVVISCANKQMICQSTRFHTLNINSSFIPKAPTIISTSLIDPTENYATFAGRVNPNGDSTIIGYQITSGSTISTESLVPSCTPLDLHACRVRHLLPNTEYQFRIYATNSFGSDTSIWKNFKTLFSSNFEINKPTDTKFSTPSIYETFISDVTSTSAKFNGVINPNGGNTYASFLTNTGNGGQYGQQNLGGDTSVVNMIPFTITSLSPNTTYQFKIFASNPNGVVDGNWVFFTTTKEVNIDSTLHISNNSELDSINSILNKYYSNLSLNKFEINKYIRMNHKLRNKGNKRFYSFQKNINKIKTYTNNLKINLNHTYQMNTKLNSIDILIYDLKLNELKSIHTLNVNFNLLLKSLLNNNKILNMNRFNEKYNNLKLNILSLYTSINAGSLGLNISPQKTKYNITTLIYPRIINHALHEVNNIAILETTEKIVIKVKALIDVANNSLNSVNGLTVNYFYFDLLKVIEKDIIPFIGVTSPSYDYVEPGNYYFYLTYDYGPKKLEKSIKKQVDLTIDIKKKDQPFIVEIPVFK